VAGIRVELARLDRCTQRRLTTRMFIAEQRSRHLSKTDRIVPLCSFSSCISCSYLDTLRYLIPEFISISLRFLFSNQSIRIGRSSLDKLSSKAVFVSFDTFGYFTSHRCDHCLHRPGSIVDRVVLVSAAALCSPSLVQVSALVRSVLVSAGIITNSLLAFGVASFASPAACDRLSRDREPNSLVPGY